MKPRFENGKWEYGPGVDLPELGEAAPTVLPPRVLTEDPDAILPMTPPWAKAVLKLMGSLDLRRIHATCRLETHAVFQFQESETMEEAMVRLSAMSGAWRIAATFPKDKVFILERTDAIVARTVATLVRGARYVKSTPKSSKARQAEAAGGGEAGHLQAGRRGHHGAVRPEPGGDPADSHQGPGGGGVDPEVSAPELPGAGEVGGSFGDEYSIEPPKVEEEP